MLSRRAKCHIFSLLSLYHKAVIVLNDFPRKLNVDPAAHSLPMECPVNVGIGRGRGSSD